MCGINGIVNFISSIENKNKIIKSMNDSLIHRGPDGEGTFISKNRHIIFGHRRLSIVDIKGGMQPITVIHRGYEYSIVFNGEIYNYKELRKKLKKKGYVFKTKSDTEVLLNSYIEWGAKCVKKFNGPFAFAIYDSKSNRVYLARDRLGIKPLYYSVLKDGTLIFSSEPKGILQHPKFEKEPDNETIVDFFLGTFVLTDSCPTLNRSFFKNIYSLEPGTYALFGKNNLKITQYWDIPINKKSENFKSDIPKLLKKELEKAILIRIPEEVKFGTTLSGGIDSSIITSTTADNYDGQVISSTIKFKNQDNSDFSHAKLLAKEKKLKLLETNLTPKKMISTIDAMVKAMDEPHDTVRQLGLFATYLTLYKASCKVVLIGEGSDEFNLGYYFTSPGFNKDLDLCYNSKTFRKIWKKRSKHALKYFNKDFLKSIQIDKIIDYNISNYYEKCKSDDPTKKMEYFYTKKFLKYRLDANDRCSMAHSVEARVPFCDHNFVKIALQVPHKLNIKNNCEKYILRQAFRNSLPKEIYNRRKYPLPENEEIEFHRLIAKELDNNVRNTNPAIWKILNKNHIISLNKNFKNKIRKIAENGNGTLTKEILMSDPTDLRSKHIFIALTFMRWFNIYFN